MRWSTATTGIGLRDFMTTDARWYGCNGDTREDDYGFGDMFFFRGVVGVVRRPDQPSPSGTVPIYAYESTIAGIDPMLVYTFPTLGEDRFLSRDVGPVLYDPTFGQRYDRKRLEGYALSADHRLYSPSQGEVPVYITVGVTSGDFDLANVTTSTGSEDLQFYVWPESVVDVSPPGDCETDTDCPTSQLCYRVTTVVPLSEGPRGRCARRCVSSAECDSELPVCDVMSGRCARPVVSFTGSDALFTRASAGSYQRDAATLMWAGEDEPRYEDLGDGFGAQLLVEEAAENLIAYTNDWTTEATMEVDGWTLTNQTAYRAASSPGPHPSTLLTKGSGMSAGTAAPNVSVPLSATWTSAFSLSWWSKSHQDTGAYEYVDGVPEESPYWFGTLSNMPEAAWRRTSISNLILDDTSPTGDVVFSIPTGAPEGDGRFVAYAQLEERAFPTSVIYQDGESAARAADELTVQLETFPFPDQWRFYIWPKFSCSDLWNDHVLLDEPPVSSIVSFIDSEDEVVTEMFLRYDVGTSLCELHVSHPSWSEDLVVGGLWWQRNQLLGITLNSPFATTVGVLGAAPFDACDPAGCEATTSESLAWPEDTRMKIAGFSGRISPPLRFAQGTGEDEMYEPPTILQQKVDFDGTTAVVSFATTNHCDAVVEWGTDEMLDEDEVDASSGTLHAAYLSPVSSATLYHYRLKLECDNTAEYYTDTTTFMP